MKKANNTNPGATEGAPPLHPFEADPKDHCETDVLAHRDIVAALTIIAKRAYGYKSASDLKIWDPYFCDGKVKQNLASLGFPNCHNACEDFYARVEAKSLPVHDVVVTNPPYSTEHIERCLAHCLGQEKPWLLLLPNWVARKDALSKPIRAAFVLSPVHRYNYWMPHWAEEGRPDYVGADGKHSPFLSSWFIGIGNGGSAKTTAGTTTEKMPQQLTVDDLFEALDRIAQGRSAPEFACPRAERMPWVVARTAKGTKWKIQKQQSREGASHGQKTKGNEAAGKPLRAASDARGVSQALAVPSAPASAAGPVVFFGSQGGGGAAAATASSRQKNRKHKIGQKRDPGAGRPRQDFRVGAVNGCGRDGGGGGDGGSRSRGRGRRNDGGDGGRARGRGRGSGVGSAAPHAYATAVGNLLAGPQHVEGKRPAPSDDGRGRSKHMRAESQGHNAKQKKSRSTE
jgi:hypothetical protein